MRRAHRQDRNHHAVVAALKGAGCRVLDLSGLGGGAPDLLVAYRGANVLLEVKDSDKAPSRRALTPDERRFHESWPGEVHVVGSPAEAVEMIMARDGRTA